MLAALRREFRRRTHLQDQETLVIQVDSSCLQERGDLGKSTRLFVDTVFRGIVPERCPGNDKLRPGNKKVSVGIRLQITETSVSLQ